LQLAIRFPIRAWRLENEWSAFWYMETTTSSCPGNHLAKPIALALAWHWSVIQIGEVKSPSFGQWEIRSKEFRENLEWAVIVPGDREPSPGVMQLLGELSARGVTIRRLSGGCW
jgi:hypothetical protein